MKKFFLLITLSLVGCTSFLEQEERAYKDYQNSIDRYVKDYPNYSDKNIEELKSSVIRTGMTLLEVKIAVGIEPFGDKKLIGGFLCDGKEVVTCTDSCERCSGSMRFEERNLGHIIDLSGAGANPSVTNIELFGRLPNA